MNAIFICFIALAAGKCACVCNPHPNHIAVATCAPIDDTVDKALNNAFSQHRTKRDALDDVVKMSYGFGMLDCATPSCTQDALKSSRARSACPYRQGLINAMAKADVDPDSSLFDTIVNAYVDGYFLNC
jgi:hypothetical protein